METLARNILETNLKTGTANNSHWTSPTELKRSVNLYSDFYSSDIILASPLGLIDKIGLANDNKEKDVDYLSSIEYTRGLAKCIWKELKLFTVEMIEDAIVEAIAEYIRKELKLFTVETIEDATVKVIAIEGKRAKKAEMIRLQRRTIAVTARLVGTTKRNAGNSTLNSDRRRRRNWGYLDKVVKHLNQIPRRQHGTNIMRIRKWYLNGHAPFYRQTIILGSLLNPDINGFFHNNCLNYQGKVRSVTEHKGVLAKVLLEVRQVYERFDVTSFDEEHDARFNFFTKKVFPKINHCIEGGTMIICSYFEYTQIRTFLKSQNASFCTLQDFSKPSDISRARVWFFEGKKKIMIYTERAHFYRRYKIRGVKNLIFYSLPERKEFYPEIVNMLEGSDKMECTVLFSSFDKLKLKRIVGDSHSKRMLLSDKSIFVLK
ncbi:hypothetical protein GIB67_009265 [Kingdonia uniflora]|uniref:Uncharacterized protein n=1 Tax=Kingdonia uniflora TaxID=39325 RepID=A0A7J7N2P2_9MAGN|nr:hypothetical protein GIB67_009265 [Kingdonia uniflora]